MNFDHKQRRQFGIHQIRTSARVRLMQLQPPEKETMPNTVDTPDAPAPAGLTVKHLIPAPINLGVVAKRLSVSLQELADAVTPCGKSTMHNIVNKGFWPTKRVIRRQALVDLLRAKGANEQELETLFEATPQAMTSNATTSSKSKPTAEDPIMLIGKQTLSMAARKQFGLFSNPFDAEVASAEEMFLSGEIRFIREACWATAANGAFVAVVGESGAGKTTILADLKERVAESGKTVIWIEPSVVGMKDTGPYSKLRSGDILAAGVSALDSQAGVKQGTQARTTQFLKLLTESVQAGNSHLIVIEEAHSLPTDTLTHLKRLHERSRVGRRPALGILLLAQPELLLRLNSSRHDVREVFQRIEILQLMPLDSDLGPYLAHRVRQAGKQLGDLITDDGVAELRTRLTVERRNGNSGTVRTVSLVYPLAVNNLITACLNRAAELGVPVVNKDIVRAA
jgi:type II secretory pathway predicted ATPase ExeA